MHTVRFTTARRSRLWAIAAAIVGLAVLPLLAQVGTPSSNQLAQPSGDSAAGRALVEISKCLDCPRIGGKSSRLGPDLSDIGSRRPADLLRRALVAPDDEVLPEHRFVRVVTKEGVTVVGRLLNQDAFSIQLMNAAERRSC